ncbi:hypothetical protein E4U57_003376, partial [Claviceps arundinis]
MPTKSVLTSFREDRRTSRVDVPLKLPSTRTLLLTEISLFLLTLLIFKGGDSEGERLVKPSDKKESPEDSLLADPTVSNHPAAGVVLIDPALENKNYGEERIVDPPDKERRCHERLLRPLFQFMRFFLGEPKRYCKILRAFECIL